MIQRDHDNLRASCCVRCLKALFSRFGRNDGRAQYAASPPREKPVHYCVRNALGTAIVKPIDLTKDETELAYNQQILSIVQRRLYRLRCQCKKLGKLLRHHAADNAGHERGAQLIGQLFYRLFHDVSDRTFGHLALPEQLLAATRSAALTDVTPAHGASRGIVPFRPVTPDRHPVLSSTGTG